MQSASQSGPGQLTRAGLAIGGGREASRRPVVAVVALLVLGVLGGCGRPESTRVARERPRGLLAVRVLSDTGRSMTLSASPPPMVRVSQTRVAPVRAGVPEPPLPAAEPDSSLPSETSAPVADSRVLVPPTLEHPGSLNAPRHLRRAATVELDVRVDALGRVAEVRWAAGDSDSALVRAAEQCAEAMEFHPATLAGRPVEVWCRQRFEFTPR